ncbi:MAG TPA: DUF2332 domain-containing protein [Thermoleophilaceae bacterium]|nr:DUF2332 domain-containing protein [Thermoleophilaceae bacterium]
MSDAAGDLAQRLRWQADWCGRLGSPLYRDLMLRAAGDVEAGGPTLRVLEGREDDPYESMLQLRFMGAVHRLALEGKAKELAARYPSTGGEGDPDSVWEAFRATIEARADELRGLVERPVQTNEPGRARALAGGFLVLAAETGLPLRPLELGASAGLNLRWDGYRYDDVKWAFGDPGSPVRFRDFFVDDARPPLPAGVEIAERAGCDAAPVDPTTEEGRLTLKSYLWPDQTDRLRLLDAALAVADRVPAPVEGARAGDWLERRLASGHAGACTVVFHSIVMQYVAEEEREQIDRLLASHGADASDDAPLARLAMEPGGEEAHLTLTLWPGGEERLLATSGYHGAEVRWLATSARRATP